MAQVGEQTQRPAGEPTLGAYILVNNPMYICITDSFVRCYVISVLVEVKYPTSVCYYSIYLHMYVICSAYCTIAFVCILYVYGVLATGVYFLRECTPRACARRRMQRTPESSEVGRPFAGEPLCVRG